jgi:hypothetical protein
MAEEEAGTYIIRLLVRLSNRLSRLSIIGVFYGFDRLRIVIYIKAMCHKNNIILLNSKKSFFLLVKF